MIHLGDITKINGAEIEPVWCITGGSPCQDLSIAGKRAGLAGARSGLFMEQVRIVKEMRAEDKRNGRTGDMVRPRFLVWENVVGAFSSNRGKDFAAVLEEIIKIVEPEAPGIEVPEKGWPTWGGYHDEMGGRWSVVWRTHDAQYWGVPQRRRRISVVADFGGDTASEIQFDGESLPGDIAESGAAGEGFAEAAESGFNPAVGDCMTAWDCQSKRIFDTNGKSPTLQGGVGGGVNNPAIFAAIPINDKATRWQGGGESRNHDGSGNGLGIGKEGDPSPTLTAGDRHGVMCMTPWEAQSQRVYDGNGVSPTLSSRENSGLNREAVLCAGFKAGQGAQTYPVQNMVVRRLTPLECTRLQGYPDGWVDIGDWTDEKGKEHKDADSPKYKALGNSIALPFWDWMLRRMARYLPEDATLGSLFDGIAGFPLIWERIHGKGTARWASEIEPFPIAVTKKHFPEEE